jgi:cysteine synthase A
VKVVLADPQGSSLFSRVKYGVCFTSEQRERKLKKHRYDSIVEGVGLDRITANFQNAIIDDAVKVDDQEILDMAHWLLREENLFVGSSSALNIVAACKAVKDVMKDCRSRSILRVVTIVCDSGERHKSRFWNSDFIENFVSSEGIRLNWPDRDVVPKCLQ